MSLDSWNRLPEHLQKLIQDVHFEYINVFERDGLRVVAESRQQAREFGMEFIKFQPADAAWFVKLASQVEAEKMLKKAPEYGPELLEVVGAVYK